MRSDISLVVVVCSVLLLSSVSAADADDVHQTVRQQQQRRLLAMSRHLLADAQVAQCKWSTKDKKCEMNPAAAFSVSATPPNSVAKATLLVAAQSYTCTQYNSSTLCMADSNCSYSAQREPACDVKESAVQSLVIPTLLCSGSKAYFVTTCATFSDKSSCTAMSGCSWASASRRKLLQTAAVQGASSMCMSTDLLNAANSTDKTAYASLTADMVSYSPNFWGTCDGARVLKASVTTCNHTTSTACQANSMCRWLNSNNATTDDTGSSCDLTESGSMTVLLGDNDFAKAVLALDSACSAKTTQADCAAVTKVTINTDKVAEAKTYKPTNAGFMASVPVLVVSVLAMGVALLI
eukprot:jgi/Chrzof1/8262/Cz03g03170.t1